MSRVLDLIDEMQAHGEHQLVAVQVGAHRSPDQSNLHSQGVDPHDTLPAGVAGWLLTLPTGVNGLQDHISAMIRKLQTQEDKSEARIANLEERESLAMSRRSLQPRRRP